MTLTALTKSPIFFYQLGSQITQFAVNSLGSPEKIYKTILPIFKGGSSLFFYGYGSKELCLDARQKYISDSSQTERTHRCLCQAITTRYNYALFHGMLFLGAGTLTAFEALHEFALLNLGKYKDLVSFVGSGFFVFANLVALEQNIFLYRLAEKKCPHETELRTSAILGIMSNLGYITAATIALVGLPTAIAVLIGCISACFGGVKILYDFYTTYLQKKV